MKKIFLIACVAAASLMACNSSETSDNSATTTTTTDSTNDTMLATTYTPSEGDVTFRNDKLMVYRNDGWVETTDQQTVGNGIIVHTNGQVTNGDQADTLTDGEVVSHTGTFFDKTGHAIKDAWGATKHGVGEAGEAVGKAAGDAGEAVGHAASKTGKAVKDAVTGDKDEKK